MKNGNPIYLRSYLLGAVVVFLASIGYVAYLFLPFGTPWIFPGSVLTLIPELLLSDALQAINLSPVSRAVLSMAGGGAFMATFYLVWSLPLALGQIKIPLRSTILALVSIILSATWLAFGLSAAWKYQGPQWVYLHYGYDICYWLALLYLIFCNQKAPSYVINVLFHLILFAWLGAIAFPWLGEPI